jgi:hypothetical protein
VHPSLCNLQSRAQTHTQGRQENFWFCCTDSLFMTHRGGLSLSIIIWRIGGGGQVSFCPEAQTLTIYVILLLLYKSATTKFVYGQFYLSFSYTYMCTGDCHDRLVVRFTTAYAISAYHHQRREFESRSGQVHSIQHYYITI